MTHPNLTIKPIPILNDNYIWTVINLTQQMAIVIDPGESEKATKYLKQHGLSLQAILITHHHWDHTNGIPGLLEHYECPVYAPFDERIAHVTHSVHTQDTVRINHFPAITVMSIPGHTKSHLAYHFENHLFCGDTLFAAGCGRLFEGSPEEMYASLQAINQLSSDTKIYCAHEYTLANLKFAKLVEPDNHAIAERYREVLKLTEQHIPTLPTLLALERMTNPFLRCQQPMVKQQVENYIKRSLSSPVEVFTYLRYWKDNFKN